MKNWINGFGTCFALMSALGLGLWIWSEYRNTEHGYTIAHRAELQAKFDNLVPLSLADIGEQGE